MKYLLYLSAFCLLPFTGIAQKTTATKATVKEKELQPDVSKLASNLMQVQRVGLEQYFTFWMPAAYMSAVLRASNRFSEKDISAIEKKLKTITIIWVSRFDVSATGKLVSDDAATIRNAVLLRDKDGSIIQPLDSAAIPSDLAPMFEVFKPIISKMLGDVGAGLEFMVYNNTDDQGNELLSPTAAGSFKLNLFDKTFVYRTPLPAFLPPKFCPADKAEMEGDWLYCPYHGTALK